MWGPSKRVRVPQVDPAIKAARAQMAAEKAGQMALSAIEDLARDRETTAAKARDLLDQALGDKVPEFVAMILGMNATQLKEELIHLGKVHAARKHLAKLKAADRA